MQKLLGRLGKHLGCASFIAIVAAAALVSAQKDGGPVPYASIASNGVSYDGPGREATFDLAGPTIHIGLLAPVHGPRKADGEAIIQAAQMALRDASSRPLPGGLHLALDIADESVPPWGLLGDEIIHLVVHQKVIAIVTCADGVAAHLSEQIGNKIGVPTLTLSTDPTTTQINMPWIFRMGASDTQQAQLIARNLYQVRGFRRVLLVTGSDHDGRVGGREFVQAVHQLGAPGPASVIVNPLHPDARPLLNRIKAESPQAIVFWTRPENAKTLLETIRGDSGNIPVYFSEETAQRGSGVIFSREVLRRAKGPSGAGIYTVVSELDGTSSRKSFDRDYQVATGTFPSPAAAETYDAVWLIARAVREAGPNRARVRDRIASVRDFPGVSGMITFDDEGNNRANVHLVRLQRIGSASKDVVSRGVRRSTGE